MTPEEFAALGVATDLRTAARALKIGKTLAYELAKADEFPCRVIPVGTRYIVPTAGLRDLLGLGSEVA